MDAGIIVILIGVIGSIVIVGYGIWMLAVQLKKNAQYIEEEHEIMNDIKLDIDKINMKISYIEEYTFELRDNMIKKNERVDMAIDGIGELINRQRADDLMTQKISKELEKPIYVKNLIDLVYKKNTELNKTIQKLSEDCGFLSRQAFALTLENEKLSKEINHKS